MKFLVFASLAVFAFSLGWISHGLMNDNHRTEELSAVAEEDAFVEYAPQDSIPQLTLHNPSASSAGAELVLYEAEQGNFYQALLIIQNARMQLSNNELDLLGRTLVDFALAEGIDSYLVNDDLQNLASYIALAAPYSPAGQFFSVIQQSLDEPIVALANLDELTSYYQEQVSTEQLSLLESWLLDKTERDLLAAQNWSGLTAWYQVLLARASDPLEIYERMAAVYASAGRFYESSRALEQIAVVSELDESQKKLLADNRDEIALSSIAQVQMRRQGEHFIVPVRLNGELRAELLLDTGASISGLDAEFSQSNGLELSGSRIWLGTASGRVEAGLIDLASMSVGSTQVSHLRVAQIDLGGSHQGLLGMDFLGEFEFYIDQQGSVLYLRPQGQDAEILFLN